MTAPPPGAQISEDGFYWWNDNTGDANEPARWELLDNSAQAASAAAAQSASSTQADPNAAGGTSEQNSSQQSDMGDVTLDWEYTANDDLGIALDELVASGWEPGSEDEMA